VNLNQAKQSVPQKFVKWDSRQLSIRKLSIEQNIHNMMSNRTIDCY